MEPSKAGEPAELPLQWRPYRVRVDVAFDGSARFTPDYRNRTTERLEEAVRRTWGPMWELDDQGGVRENGRLSPPTRDGLERLTDDECRQRYADGDWDKVFVLAVDAIAARFVVSGREWDPARQTLGPTLAGETYHPHAVSDVAVRVMGELFSPLLSIEETDVIGRKASLWLRAGGLPPTDPQVEQIRPGDVLQPFLKYLDRDRTVRQVQVLPWTYMVVDRVDGGFVTCSLVTGLRSPLGARRRRLVESWAVRIRPYDDESRLQLVLRSQRDKPLIGYSVSVSPKTFVQEEPQSEPAQLVTDRRGAISISASREQPIVWLYVHSGDVLLARVPHVPGVRPHDRFELPDDSLRLTVEGELSLLKGRLIDTVAQRATLSARALRLARAGRFRAVPNIVKELDELPDAGRFESQLTAIRVPAIEQARARNDRAAEARIRRLCSDTSGLIQNYLDPDKIRRLKEVLTELKAVDEKPAQQGRALRRLSRRTL